MAGLRHFAAMLLLGAAAPVSILRGQEIVTDRPDVTEASTVVPKGSLQIENGLSWTTDHGTRTLDLTQSLVRVGISRRTELRVGVPDFLSGYGRLSGSGFGDVSIGVKQQIGPLPGGFDLAVIAALSLPTGAERESSHGYDPFIKLPWSRALSDGWSVGGMFSTFWYTEEGHRRFLWEPTVYIEKELTKPWDVFLEYGGDYPTHTESRQLLHAGTAYKLTPRNQVDFHAGYGLTHATPGHFVAVGYSFRLDHVFRSE